MSDLVYFVVPAGDAERAKTFYGSVLDWEFTPGSVPNGYNIEKVSPPGGLSGGSTERTVEVYFGVEDIRAAVARVRELGGEADEIQEADHGSYASCRDDQRTSFSLYQSRST
jgi:predicted enzyme related to lactoylglutathione lyase